MKTLAVVRYKYSAAQALTEILRGGFDSSDEESNSCDLDVDIDEDAVKNTLKRSE